MTFRYPKWFAFALVLLSGCSSRQDDVRTNRGTDDEQRSSTTGEVDGTPNGGSPSTSPVGSVSDPRPTSGGCRVEPGCPSPFEPSSHWGYYIVAEGEDTRIVFCGTQCDALEVYDVSLTLSRATAPDPCSG